MKSRLRFTNACFASLIGFLQCVCAYGETIVVTPEKPEVPATLRPGDVVVFKGGVYKGKFSFADLAGAANAPIVIRSETPGGAVFDGAEPISLAWKKKGDLYVAVSDKPPHALYRNGEFMRHFGDAKSLKPGTYNVSGAGPWTVTYRPLANEDPASLQFSRGVMESAFSLIKCSYVVLEGFRIVRFGMEKPPTDKFGITRFGGSVIGASECRNVTLRGLTVDGFFSVGVNIGRCNDTAVEDTVIRNGYGAAIGFNSDTAITSPSYLYRNNAARGCDLSDIYRFNKSQAGYSIKGIGVNGNQIGDTVIEKCVLHSIPQTAIHFDVRSGFATVRNCLFFNNSGGLEIHLENRIHDVAFENNLFTSSHCGSTIKYSRCWNIVLRHNTFYRTCGYNLALEAAYNSTIQGNLFYAPAKGCMKISEQAMAGQKVKRGLVMCNGKLLYDYIKSSKPGISVDEINARLKWAGVAPLNPDGSEPDDITWKGRAEAVKAGNRVMSARDNPNGNGIDLDPPAEIKNTISGNAWFMERGAPFTIYRAPNEKTAKSATARELKAKNPAWDFSGGMGKITFADRSAFDLRVSMQGVGASDDALAWAREQLARLGAKNEISSNSAVGAEAGAVKSAPLLGLPGWDMTEGSKIEGSVLTIVGNKNEYRAARLILPVGAAMKRGAFAIAGEVKITGLKPGANSYDCAKFKVYFGKSKKDKAQPLLMSSDTADWTPMTLECRLPDPGVSNIMVEVGLQYCQGTFQVRSLKGPASR